MAVYPKKTDLLQVRSDPGSRPRACVALPVRVAEIDCLHRAVAVIAIVRLRTAAEMTEWACVFAWRGSNLLLTPPPYSPVLFASTSTLLAVAIVEAAAPIEVLSAIRVDGQAGTANLQHESGRAGGNGQLATTRWLVWRAGGGEARATRSGGRSTRDNGFWTTSLHTRHDGSANRRQSVCSARGHRNTATLNDTTRDTHLNTAYMDSGSLPVAMPLVCVSGFGEP